MVDRKSAAFSGEWVYRRSSSLLRTHNAKAILKPTLTRGYHDVAFLNTVVGTSALPRTSYLALWKGRKLMVPYDIVAIIKVPSDAIGVSISVGLLACSRCTSRVRSISHTDPYHHAAGRHAAMHHLSGGEAAAVVVGKYIAPRTVFRFNIKGFIFNLITVKIHSSLL